MKLNKSNNPYENVGIKYTRSMYVQGMFLKLSVLKLQPFKTCVPINLKNVTIRIHSNK